MGVLCLSLLWCALLYVLSSFAIILNRKKRAGLFAYIVFRISFHCKCYVALPHGAVGCSAEGDCGIS